MISHLKEKTVEDYLESLQEPRRSAVLAFHAEWLPYALEAKGSQIKHQAWEGGYLDHLAETMRMAEMEHIFACEMYPETTPFALDSAIVVLYFHDIEKLWKYSSYGLLSDFDKWSFYIQDLPALGIAFDDAELNALKYIHGEGDDYDPLKNVMGPLAAICHCCDTKSARAYSMHGRGRGSRNREQ